MNKPHPVLEKLMQRAKERPARIVLPEGDDERIQQAAILAADQSLAQPVLLGNRKKLASLLGKPVSDGVISVIEPETFEHLEQMIDAFVELRAHKGMTADKAKTAMADPMQFAAMMVRLGLADATVGGAVASTADTVRAALQIIGKAADTKVVSSAMLMLNAAQRPGVPDAMVFTDCALIVDPDSTELMNIAHAAANTCQTLLDEAPRLALLSFSTAGSAKHARVEKVQEAIAQLRSTYPELDADGDLQFDAALSPDIAARKAPESTVAGKANVFVFPSLEAGNIGYKIAQRLGGFAAIGPILQGLAKPANDLSRGCSTEDVVQLLALTSLQATPETS